MWGWDSASLGEGQACPRPWWSCRDAGLPTPGFSRLPSPARPPSGRAAKRWQQVPRVGVGGRPQQVRGISEEAGLCLHPGRCRSASSLPAEPLPSLGGASLLQSWRLLLETMVTPLQMFPCRPSTPATRPRSLFSPVQPGAAGGGLETGGQAGWLGSPCCIPSRVSLDFSLPPQNWGFGKTQRSDPMGPHVTPRLATCRLCSGRPCSTPRGLGRCSWGSPLSPRHRETFVLH